MSCFVVWQIGINMLEEPASAETSVPHVYQITQSHSQIDCDINIQLLENLISRTLLLCLAYPIQKASFCF